MYFPLPLPVHALMRHSIVTPTVENAENGNDARLKFVKDSRFSYVRLGCPSAIGTVESMSRSKPLPVVSWPHSPPNGQWATTRDSSLSASIALPTIGYFRNSPGVSAPRLMRTSSMYPRQIVLRTSTFPYFAQPPIMKQSLKSAGICGEELRSSASAPSMKRRHCFAFSVCVLSTTYAT